MDFKLSVFFTNGKDLVMVLEKTELAEFLTSMSRNKPRWNKEGKSGFGLPLYNVMYYSFIEYTEAMKKEDAERVKKAQEATAFKQKAAKEENKETNVEAALDGPHMIKRKDKPVA